ncbi:hypothetical protein TNCV_27091 [Trichonephila clavipes]|uniref:Uncharacterized protein n=1 Tax=Trichonephila clavipes TaxID=2585209 RepID=A0A8X6WK05_TRICX|nr:hypothetical protein TNCV_27091 [Trichonephila clavipes]
MRPTARQRSESSIRFLEVIETRENESQVAKIVNGVYGADTLTDNYVQFRFLRFRSGIFVVKDAHRIGRPVVKNVDKIT